MALNRETLVVELSRFMDPDHESFDSFPESDIIAASLWSNAFSRYVESIEPKSNTINASKLVLESSLIAMFNVPGAFQNRLAGSIQVFANSIALGMISSGYTATNTARLNYSNVFSSDNKTASEIIQLISTLTHEYFLSGTAVNISGEKINWI